MKVVACYSNKGGVGKTAAAVNMAVLAARSGRRTLLCDLDPQGASSFYFRVKPSTKLTPDRFIAESERLLDAIRESDFPNLDILPSNMSFRHFDVLLHGLKNSRSRLRKALKGARGDYDVVLLDCPPSLSTLSENVFRAADYIVVPVIPTTLSERTLEQLYGFFDHHDLSRKKLLPFFSMVQRRKSLHGETMTRLKGQQGKHFLKADVPFSTDVERMGMDRVPAAISRPTSAAARAYSSLWQELAGRLA
jgi:chromosome partitioning protein